MSIIVSVKVNDGIVLGADSAAAIWAIAEDKNEIGIAQVWMHANKLFDIDGLPIGVATWGVGNIGKRSIENLIHEFCQDVVKPKKLKQVNKIALELRTWIGKHYTAEFSGLKKPPPALGFYICGYNISEPLPIEFEFNLPSNKIDVKQVRNQDVYGASWRGISAPFSRLYFGFDDILKHNVLSVVKEKETQDMIANIFDMGQSQVMYDGMPIIEAVKFARFVLETTINMQYFNIGPPLCAKPISLLTIQKGKGLQWINKIEIVNEGGLL